MSHSAYEYDSTLRNPYSAKALLGTLAFSSTGQFLVAGDNMGAVLLYNVKRRNHRKLARIGSSVTTCIWLPEEPMTAIVGSDDGALVAIKVWDGGNDIREAEGTITDSTSVHRMLSGRINCIASNEDGTKLYINHGQKITKVETPCFGTWENAVAFPSPSRATGGSGRNFEVNVTSLHYILSKELVIVTYRDHGIIGYDVVGDPKTLWRVETPDNCFRIGGASISPSLDSLVTLDLFSGLDFYNYSIGIGSGGALQHAYSALPGESFPTKLKLPIVHTTQGGRSRLVCGCSEGGVRILNANDGDLIQRLDRPCHDSALQDLISSKGHFSQLMRSKVHAMACTDFDGTNIIATSSCTYDGSSVIDFWISNRDMDPFGLKRLQSEGHGLFLSLRNVLWALIKGLVWGAFILVAFVLYLEVFEDGIRMFMLDVVGGVVDAAETFCLELPEFTTQLDVVLNGYRGNWGCRAVDRR